MTPTTTERLRHEADQLEKQRIHEIAVAKIIASQRKGVHPGVVAILVVWSLGCTGAAYYYGAYMPRKKSDEALSRARKYAESDAPNRWCEARGWVGGAKMMDPTNPEIEAVWWEVEAKECR